jgi:hypothetical protein
MAAAKGTRPPNAGKGRPKGVPNKVSGELKEMILLALSERGGVTYLVEQADKNPAAFMTLLGKVLPMQVTGEGGGALRIRWEQ